MKFLTLLIASALWLTCSKENTGNSSNSSQQFTLSGTVENAPADVITITFPSTAESMDVTLDENNSFTATIDVDGANYGYFNMGRQFGRLYAQPGDEITFTVNADDFDNTITFSGSSAAENNHTAKRYVEYAQIRSKFSNKNVYTKPYNEFLTLIDEEKQWSLNFLEANKEGLSERFIELEKKNANYSHFHSKADYERFAMAYSGGEPIELPDGYDQLYNELDLTDPDLTKYPNFDMLVEKALQNQEPKLGMGLTAQEYFQGMYKRALDLENPKLKEAMVAGQINNMISYGEGYDAITTEIDDFMAFAKNPMYIKKINSLVEIWEPLKKGNPAPSFVAKYIDDSDFASGDLKGKNIYVDVWATWCGPCIREIPYLKEVEHDYEDKNIEFLSVSIDEEAQTQKWKDFVNDEELGGTQVHARKAWQSEIAKKYQIQGIPRFMIIDADGNIVTANAPRPSEDRLRTMLDELIAKK